MKKFSQKCSQISDDLKKGLSSKNTEAVEILRKLSEALPLDSEHSIKDKVSSDQIAKAMDNTHQLVKGIEQKVVEQQEREKLNELFPYLVMIMLIGKVNCGKSTLGEYLAELFSKLFALEWFEIDGAGNKVPADAGFETAGVECTSSLKGFVAGPFVFIDTPGLHSMTQENGDLTKRIAQSADIVLCCTHSGMPGQAVEMDYFSDSIRSQTPYIPIITQSDKKVAQLNQDRELVEVWEMKPKEGQLSQQEHVKKSLSERLPYHDIKTPLSVSVLMAKKGDNNVEILLDFILDVSLSHVLEHKVEKSVRDQNNLLKMTQKLVMQEVGVEVDQASRQIQNLKTKIKQDVEGIKADLTRNFSPVLLQKINQYKEKDDIRGLKDTLSADLAAQWQVDATKAITKNFESADVLCRILQISNASLGKFEAVTREVRSSNNKGKLIGSGLGLLGFLGGPVTGFLTSTAGGLIGGCFDDDDVFDEVIGVDTRNVEAKAEQWLESSLNFYGDQLMEQVEESLFPVIKMLTQQAECIEMFNQQVNAAAYEARLNK